MPIIVHSIPRPSMPSGDHIDRCLSPSVGFDFAIQARWMTAFYPETAAYRTIHISSLLFDRCSYLFLFLLYVVFILPAHTHLLLPLEIHWTVLEELSWQLLKRRYIIVTTLQSRGVSLPLPSSVVGSCRRLHPCCSAPDSIFTLRPRSFHVRQLLFILLCTFLDARTQVSPSPRLSLPSIHHRR